MVNPKDSQVSLRGQCPEWSTWWVAGDHSFDCNLGTCDIDFWKYFRNVRKQFSVTLECEPRIQI